MTEPYIESLWAVTFTNPETGASTTLTAPGESKQQAVDAAAWKLEGGPWHYVIAVRIHPML